MTWGDIPLEFFHEYGYVRRICPSCGAYYWSLNGISESCGDVPCVEYSFIGNPSTKKSYEIDEMRNFYLKFFERRGHEIIDRYPVIPRWRDDVLLVNASIYDFQPHVTSGEVPPPANPLVISQPCIRLTDIDSVGKSGRHLSNFEMMAHHAFNYPNKKIYWCDETTKYCHELLLELGINESKIIYKENPWTGGGNAGMAVEVMVDGLELSTLVFMNLKRMEKGNIEIKGEKYSKMDIDVVDTGYGLERFVWVSKGTPTIYDSIYPKALEKIKSIISLKVADEYKKILSEIAQVAGIMEVSSTSHIEHLRREVISRLKSKGISIEMEEIIKITEPLEKIYTIADHARCILLMLSDGIVPSNVKTGYLARLIFRKMMRAMGHIGIEEHPMEIIMIMKDTVSSMVKIEEMEESIKEMIDLEYKKYKKTLVRGRDLIYKRRGKGRITTSDIIELYDSHGIHPDFVKSVCKEVGIHIDIPDNLHALISERHEKKSLHAKKESKEYKGIEATVQLYYQDMEKCEFHANVLYIEDNKVIFDKTCFYPEGGGQVCDLGIIECDGKKYQVVDVQKHGKHIVHYLKDASDLKVGDRITGKIDKMRRRALMRHHTATHIIVACARKLFGKHIWQSGAYKNFDYARIDLTHYRHINRNERITLEKQVNEIIEKNLPVNVRFMERNEAEKKYGMNLYQGGAPVGGKIRVVEIEGVDAQACGGTHCSSTGEVGFLKIIKCERIQDGVERIVFSAGPRAISYVQKIEKLAEESSDMLSVPVEHLPKTAKKFFDEWKNLKKEVNDLKDMIAGIDAEAMLRDVEYYKGFKIACGIVKMNAQGIAEKLIENGVDFAIVGCKDEGVTITRSQRTKINCVEIARDAGKIMGGGGGGREDMAHAGGKLKEKIKDAVVFALNEIKKRINQPL